MTNENGKTNTTRAELRHVFSNVPNTKSNRRTLAVLRKHFNHAEYRMRVKGRTPKAPEHRSPFGDVRLEHARAFSIYIDSDFETRERRKRWDAEGALSAEKAAHRRTCDQALADVKRLNNEVCDLIEQRKALTESRTRLTEGLSAMRAERDTAKNLLRTAEAARIRAEQELAGIPNWLRAVCRWFNTTTTNTERGAA